MTVLTEIKLYWFEGRIERWIRFGQEVDERILDRRRRVLAFKPGTVIAFVRWASNDFGTVVSRIDILRTVDDGKPAPRCLASTPGGEILLRSFGWPKVERVLKAIDVVEALGVDAGNADPNHWRTSITASPSVWSRAFIRASAIAPGS